MQQITIADWTILSDDALPAIHDAYCQHAELVETFEDAAPGKLSFFAIGPAGGDWPSIVVTQRYNPAGCLAPGILVAPDSRRAFIGAGERLLCYDLDRSARLWQDHADFGFWQWRRAGDHVIMAAELECAAWTCDGRKLWSEPVEPPWSFDVTGDAVHLDVMGTPRTINLKNDT